MVIFGSALDHVRQDSLHLVLGAVHTAASGHGRAAGGRIKLAARGAQAAADALVLVDDGHTAAEAAGRLRLDLRLREGVRSLEKVLALLASCATVWRAGASKQSMGRTALLLSSS